MKRILVFTTATLLTAAAFAGDILHWQDNSISFLAGKNFKLDPDTQETITLEHASGWSVGDLYGFVDGIYLDGDKDYKGDRASYYGEIAPRLSAGKILDKDLSVLFIKDFLVAGCFEFGKNSSENYLIGLGVDLAIPGFDFFQLNFYRRFKYADSDPESYQITPAWKVTLPLAKSAFICDGYIDWVFGKDTDQLHFNPQLKFDVGVFCGLKERSLLAGVEYDYWKNKYGVRDGDGIDSDQSALSGLIQYHF